MSTVKYGNNGVGTSNQLASNDARLRSDADYRKSELERTLKVIGNRTYGGEGTDVQKAYLNKINEYGNANSGVQYSGSSINAPVTQKVKTPTTSQSSSANRISQKDYINSTVGIATSNATSTYQSAINTLKTKLEAIKLQNQTNRQGVEDSYTQVAEQTNTDEYNDLQRVRSILARRGLLNSGVNVANSNDTGMRYAGVRSQQGIERSRALQEIGNVDTNAENEYYSEGYNAQLARDNTINTAHSQAMLDYATKLGIPYEQMDEQRFNNQFNREMSLNQFNQGVDQSNFDNELKSKSYAETVRDNEFNRWIKEEGFNEEIAHNVWQRALEDNKFNEQLAMNDFTRTMEDQKYAEQVRLNDHSMNMDEKQMQLQQDSFEWQKSYQSKQLALEASGQAMTGAYQSGQLNLSYQNFLLDQDKHIKNTDKATQEFYATAVSDTWGKVSDAIEGGQLGMINSIISTSQMPFEMKKQFADSLINSTINVGSGVNIEPMPGSTYVSPIPPEWNRNPKKDKR